MIVYTPNQGTNTEKYFKHINYRGKDADSGVKKHLSVHFFLHGPRPFNLSTEKRDRFARNGRESGYSRADTINNNINKR